MTLPENRKLSDQGERIDFPHIRALQPLLGRPWVTPPNPLRVWTAEFHELFEDRGAKLMATGESREDALGRLDRLIAEIRGAVDEDGESSMSAESDRPKPEWIGNALVAVCPRCAHRSRPGAEYPDGSGVCGGCRGTGWVVLAQRASDEEQR